MSNYLYIIYLYYLAICLTTYQKAIHANDKKKKISAIKGCLVKIKSLLLLVFNPLVHLFLNGFLGITKIIKIFYGRTRKYAPIIPFLLSF